MTAMPSSVRLRRPNVPPPDGGAARVAVLVRATGRSVVHVLARRDDLVDPVEHRIVQNQRGTLTDASSCSRVLDR